MIESDRGTPYGSSEGEHNSVSKLNESSNEDLDQASSSYEYMGHNEINTDYQDIKKKHQMLKCIFGQRHDKSTENEGFVENSIYDPLHVTEVESSDESIVVIEDDNRYVKFGRYNSERPIGLSYLESDELEEN